MSGAGDKLVLIGKVVGVHGVRGEVKIESYCDPRTRIFAYQPWHVRAATGEIVIEGCRGREQGKGLVAEWPGSADRDVAIRLIGAEIWVARAILPAVRPGEYYWFDLEGLEVATVAGAVLGRVSHVVATGANDVLVVRDGKRERLIPFLVGTFVTEVDLDKGSVTVDWDSDF